MTETEMQVLILKGMLSEMDQADQENVHGTAYEIRKLVRDAGDNGIIALVLVATEHAQ